MLYLISILINREKYDPYSQSPYDFFIYFEYHLNKPVSNFTGVSCPGYIIYPSNVLKKDSDLICSSILELGNLVTV